MNLFEDWGPWRWFKDDWLVTRQAAWLFGLSAVLQFVPLFVIEARVKVEQMPPHIRAPLGSAILLGLLGLVFLWLGMWRFWVRMDRSSKWMKRLSFGILLFGFWYGACAYYWLFYLPQVLRKETAA